ncbi:DUF4252 domain-containing protein [Pleomorphovibrio marinus]|uniref:DUF4252 domain-containing protein n=1 Tax=Pleomorphovibrio marinus TaxID=2164132 RepID=UPI000E0BF41C|nr:DUF4252 domain-containing protein [Pleomorphovibrio marinus]
MNKISIYLAAISFILGLPTLLYAQDDAISSFFSHHMEDERFSRVYISPKMMKMAGGFLRSAGDVSDEEAQKLGELISKVNGIRILSGEKVDGQKLYREAMSTLEIQRYEDLMDIKDKDSNVKFMVREEKGKIREFLMLTGSKDSFALLSLIGSFTYEDLNTLADKTNMPGMQEYNKGKNKN